MEYSLSLRYYVKTTARNAPRPCIGIQSVVVVAYRSEPLLILVTRFDRVELPRFANKEVLRRRV